MFRRELLMDSRYTSSDWSDGLLLDAPFKTTNNFFPKEKIFYSVQDSLNKFATNPDFELSMQEAFGENIDAKEIQAAWLTNDFSKLPPVEVKSSSDINGANGAYAAAVDTIFISHEFLDRNADNLEPIASVILEEIGHAVDAKLNESDSPGDEGAIFSALVQGVDLSEKELRIIKTEDDSAVVTINGETLEIECINNCFDAYAEWNGYEYDIPAKNRQAYDSCKKGYIPPKPIGSPCNGFRFSATGQCIEPIPVDDPEVDDPEVEEPPPLPSPPYFTLNEIRDFDGNDLGADENWKLIGLEDVQGDGDDELIFTNSVIGRWATVGYEIDPLTGLPTFDFSRHGWGGDTRIVGIYEDPLVQSGEVERSSPFDSQQRFQNDLFIDNLYLIENSGWDYNGDGLQELYFGLNDGTAVLHAYMHADGNIQYANYQSESDLQNYMNEFGINEWFYSDWL